MPTLKKKSQEGFTLVELMIVVAIIGILAVLAIYGVTKYITNAKTAEAKNALGQLAKAAVGAYEEERSDATYIPPGSTGLTNQHAVCTSATWVPGAIAAVSNKKYQSSQAPGIDWSLGTANASWPCLKFALTEPQYFMYNYTAIPAGNIWWAQADSDLKGTGTATLGFAIGGKTAGAQMVVLPQIQEFDDAASARPTSL